MQDAAHLSLEGIIDKLVLADARETCELGADDFGLPVVIIAGEVGERYFGIRKGFRQVFHQRVAAHSHGRAPLFQVTRHMRRHTLWVKA